MARLVHRRRRNRRRQSVSPLLRGELNPAGLSCSPPGFRYLGGGFSGAGHQATKSKSRQICMYAVRGAVLAATVVILLPSAFGLPTSPAK